MSKLIINEHPLLVLPSLATAIGLNEAIILQQVHYWLDPRTNKNIKNGVAWVYNTYTQWAKQFPFWSEVTIRRSIKSLENKGLLISCYLNTNSFNKQKWYTIDYVQLCNIEKTIVPSSSSSSPCDQIDQTDNQFDHTIRPKRSDDQINLIRSYNITETTTKTTTDISLSKFDKDIKNQDFKKEREMIEIWNKIVKKGESSSKPTELRLNNLQKVLKNMFNNELNEWTIFCQLVTQSKFLMGEVTNFKASLDWCLNPEKIQKIQEGEYGVGDRLPTRSNAISNDDTEYEDQITHPLWKEARRHIIAKLGIATFKSWIAKVDFVEEKNGVVYLKAISRFVQQYVDTHYKDIITLSWKQINPGIRDINISFVSQ